MGIYLGDKKVSTGMLAGYPEKESDVNFYDWDGTLLYAYTKSEFVQLTAMPPAPDRTGQNLVQEGWNWTLNEVQNYVQRDDVTWFGVGCTYHTLDDKTHIYATVSEDFATIWLCPTASIANDTTIDWGDGNTVTLDSTSSTQLEHTYSTFGEKDITIYSATGTHSFTNSYICGSEVNNLKSKIHTIIFSQKAKSIGTQFNMLTVEYLSIPKTSYPTNRFVCCNNARCLKHLNLATGNAVPTDASFKYCYSLRNLICKETRSSSVLENAVSLQHFNYFGSTTYTLLQNAYSLETFSFMKSTESIGAPLRYAYCLKEVTFPTSVTSIGANAFVNCSLLLKIYCKPTTPPTIQSTTFGNIPESCKIYVPRESLATYQSASNWSNHASKMVAYDFE